jgi:sialate O-acetylesterase
MKLFFRKQFTSLLPLAAFGFLGAQARADVKLPAIFSDHMVLQQNARAPVWGWADPGEKVTVSIAGQTHTATADAAGNWKLQLGKISAGRPLTLTVAGHNTIVVQDVLAGEVWLGSGQSNMQLAVNEVTNAWKEKADAKFPQMRMFTVGRVPTTTPQTNCGGKWLVCAPETVGGFSAAAYFFGRELHQKLNVPVGLIHSSWGGTPIETWTSMDKMEAKPELAPVLATWKKTLHPYDEAKAQADYVRALENWTNNYAKLKAESKNIPPPPQKKGDPRLDKNYPANLFNGMIAPIIPYAIRGAIWYQGENNAATDLAKLYSIQLTLMISDWRQRWDQGDFPFAWVQLPNFHPRTTNVVETNYNNWCVVREELLKTLAVKNTGMAVTMDVGEANNIHPKNKQAVGHRLALWALAKVYGKDIPYSGPLPDGHKIKGDEIILSFKHTDGGLVTSGGELKGLAIAGEDHKWVAANARIEGEKVIVSSPDVKSPKAVRYAWAANPDCNLFNGAGLPASPFRTDDWK